MICPNCKKEISDSSKYCPECGASISQTFETQQPVYSQPLEVTAKPKNSGMGKLALVFSLLGCTWILGLILAIIDLAHASDGRKKTCSSIALIISLFITFIVFTALSSNMNSVETTSGDNNVSEEVVFVDESKIDNVYADANNFKGQYVELKGQVFGEPEINEDAIYFQMYADADNAEKNTIVQFVTSDFKVNAGDYVKVTGEIKGFHEYENLLGGSLSAVLIDAEKVEMSNYIDCCSPTIKTVTLENNEIDQSGYVIAVDKIEFSEKETRIYVTATNNGNHEFYISDYATKAVQNQKQFECTYNYSADYEEIQSDLLPQTSTSGIILLGAMNPEENFKIYIEAYCDDWSLEFEPYVFEH